MAAKTAPVLPHDVPATSSNYERFENPQWVSLLTLLGMNDPSNFLLKVKLVVNVEIQTAGSLTRKG